MIRGHQAELEGYRLFHWNGSGSFPPLITVFSAPNYCDFYNNKAACLRVADGEFNLEQFTEAPHPYLLPQFMGSFTFRCLKSDLMYNLLSPAEERELSSSWNLDRLLKTEVIGKLLVWQKNKSVENI